MNDQKKHVIPDPPRVTLWLRKDGKECMAMLTWAKGASITYRGPDFETVERKALEHTEAEIRKFHGREEAKAARKMGRIRKKFERAGA